MAVAVLIFVPRDERGHHEWRLRLTYADGSPVRLDPPIDGIPEDFVYTGSDNVQGLDDPSLTIPLTTGMLAVLPPFPLPAGREFAWRLTIDGEEREEWTSWFRTTPPEPLA
jgi:hypothetical protein